MGVTIFRPGQRLVIPGVQVFQPRPSAGGAFTGILDSISNVAAAYSLRQLRSAYSGSAVRVRRSSDSTEQDIGFVAGEFDSSAFSSFVGGGTGYVKTWYDQSGNGRNATQATTTKQPLIVLSRINSKPAPVFDGSDDELEFTTPVTTPSALTLFCIYEHGSTSSPYTVSSGFNGWHRFTNGLSYPNDGLNFRYEGISISWPSSGTHISSVKLVASPLTWQIWSDGATKSSQSGGSTGLIAATSYLGRNAAYHSGAVAAFIYLSAAISAADHNTIGADMATRFGLSWTTVT